MKAIEIDSQTDSKFVKYTSKFCKHRWRKSILLKDDRELLKLSDEIRFLGKTQVTNLSDPAYRFCS